MREKEHFVYRGKYGSMTNLVVIMENRGEGNWGGGAVSKSTISGSWKILHSVLYLCIVLGPAFCLSNCVYI